MTPHKPSRLTLALPVVFFIVSLVSLRLYNTQGATTGAVVAVFTAGAALGLVGWLIYTHSRSLRVDRECRESMG